MSDLDGAISMAHEWAAMTHTSRSRAVTSHRTALSTGIQHLCLSGRRLLNTHFAVGLDRLLETDGLEVYAPSQVPAATAASALGRPRLFKRALWNTAAEARHFASLPTKLRGIAYTCDSHHSQTDKARFMLLANWRRVLKEQVAHLQNESLCRPFPRET